MIIITDTNHIVYDIALIPGLQDWESAGYHVHESGEPLPEIGTYYNPNAMKTITRDGAKDLFRKDVDSYGKPKKIMTKIDMIYDSFEKQENFLVFYGNKFGVAFNDQDFLSVEEANKKYNEYLDEYGCAMLVKVNSKGIKIIKSEENF